ncbi:MAG: hypothetical protein ACRCUJ_06445 [Phocaeicola sp.]
MPTSKEKAVEAKKSIYTAEELQQSYEKGRKVGQIEGIIAYQKKLIDNLQRDNEALNKKLIEVRA